MKNPTWMIQLVVFFHRAYLPPAMWGLPQLHQLQHFTDHINDTMKFCQTVTKNLPGDVVLHTIYQVCQTVLRFGRIGDIR
jgi:hypothetical protein